MTTVFNYTLIVMLFLAWVGLFAVKDASREAGMRVSALEQEIQQEEAAIGSLRTDWAILNEPGYLQALAQSYLGLGTITPQQIVTMTALPPVPLHDRRTPSTGTFYASARGFQQFPSTRGGTMRTAPRPDPFTSWAHPALRPEFGG